MIAHLASVLSRDTKWNLALAGTVALAFLLAHVAGAPWGVLGLASVVGAVLIGAYLVVLARVVYPRLQAKHRREVTDWRALGEARVQAQLDGIERATSVAAHPSTTRRTEEAA